MADGNESFLCYEENNLCFEMERFERVWGPFTQLQRNVNPPDILCRDDGKT